MAGAIMNKVWDLFGMDTERDSEAVEEKTYDNNDYDTYDGYQPTTFDQSEEICEFLKEKKSVIVNLEYVNKDVARRIVDFISGGVFALDGHIQKVSNSIFLIAPYNYEITNEMAREEISNKLSVSWLKNNTKN